MPSRTYFEFFFGIRFVNKNLEQRSVNVIKQEDPVLPATVSASQCPMQERLVASSGRSSRRLLILIFPRVLGFGRSRNHSLHFSWSSALADSEKCKSLSRKSDRSHFFDTQKRPLPGREVGAFCMFYHLVRAACHPQQRRVTPLRPFLSPGTPRARPSGRAHSAADACTSGSPPRHRPSHGWAWRDRPQRSASPAMHW